ncbi:MAG: cyanophycinase [Pseudomonadota bacterium]
MPAQVQPGNTRGYLIPIGGAEDRVHNREILQRFIDVCGEDPNIVVIPTASALPDTGPSYVEIFETLGAKKGHVLHLRDRAECESDRTRERLEKADGVFITGGNQLRLSTTIGGTEAARLLRSRNASGMPIAGTSAGAAIMPEHMIAGGETGGTPQAEMTTLAPGLGLSNKILIDQHFRQRDRIGRLLAAISYNPFPLGLGIDEDTAAFIDGDDRFEVVGSGGITILDPSHLKFSAAAETPQGRAVCMIDLRLHVLTPGCRYDITTRMASPPDRATH